MELNTVNPAIVPPPFSAPPKILVNPKNFVPLIVPPPKKKIFFYNLREELYLFFLIINNYVQNKVKNKF